MPSAVGELPDTAGTASPALLICIQLPKRDELAVAKRRVVAYTQFRKVLL